MKVTVFSILLSLSVALMAPASQADIQVTECGQGYGPMDSNLAVLLDDDSQDQVILVGYLTMGLFFELRVLGCNSLKIRGSAVTCDDQPVGVAGPLEVDVDDSPYTGPRRPVVFNPRQYDIRGSCRNSKGNPLRITLKPQN